MAFSARGDDHDVVSEINVTPLVDVMLVLLVVFLVTAPLMTSAVKVNLPKTAASGPPQENKALSVSIDAKGSVFVDRAPIALAQLESHLAALKAAVLPGQELAVHLNADEAVHYGVVAKVVSAVDRAGVNQLSVLTLAE
jgi:biopolymer transport protein ExbD